MAKKGDSNKTVSAATYEVLKQPIYTEKTAIVGGAGSTVVFKVAKRASKPAIKQAVEDLFNVEVASVRTINYRGKVKKVTRSVGYRAGFKKAYITLKPGHSIDVVEGL